MDIKNEDLKRAVLAAKITHADVMLRVLACIDGDRDFRDAMTAAVMTEDPKAIPTLAYGHFQPIEPKRNPHGQPIEPELPKLKAPVSARELAQLLNDRAVLVASKLLSSGAIDRAVTGWVKDRISKLIDAMLGIEEDGFNRIRISTSWSNTPVLKAIRARVEKTALPAVEKALDSIDFTNVTETLAVKACQEITSAYDREARDYIHEHAKSWAAERARLDIDKLIEAAESQLRGNED